jgi:hypothetical protein
MADPTETAVVGEQHDIELPGGIVVSGMGGDVEALREAFEERHEERTGETPEPEPEPEPTPTPEPKAAAAAEPPVTTPKVDKRTRGQKRFDELTAKAEEAARRAEAAEAKAKALEAKLASPVAEPPVPVVAREEPKPATIAAVDAPTRPQPLETEVGTKYATYGDFILDTARWASEQESVKLRKDLDARSSARIEAERASRSRADLATTAIARGRTAYPDFDAVLDTVADILLPPAYQDAILSVPDPEHVMYALAKDRTKLQSILKIQNGVQLGMELAKLVPSAAVAPPASTAPVVRTTNAPAPVQPVGASARTTSVSSAELADHGDDFDNSGYREKRARELGRKPVR